MLERIGEKKEEMSWRTLYILHFTLNDTTQLAKLAMYSCGLAQKEQNIMDCNKVALATKNEQTAVSQDVCQMASTMTCPMYPYIIPKRGKCKVQQNLELENN